MKQSVREEAVHHVAARLANTGQVLRAWSDFLEDDQDLQCRRLLLAVHHLEQTVGALTASGDDLNRFEAGLEPFHAFDSVPSGIERLDGAGSDVVGLRGRSEMISLVEMVAFLASLGKDGVLRARTEGDEYVIELAGGKLSYVTLSQETTEMKLGNILVEEGVLTREELERGSEGADEGELLGEALLRQGLLELDPLRAALTQQAVRIFTRMHRVGMGFTFQFEENAQLRERKDIRLGVSGLLLESARILDEERRGAGEPLVHAEADWLGVLSDPLEVDQTDPLAGSPPAQENLDLDAIAAPIPSAASVTAHPLTNRSDDLDAFRAALEERIEKELLELPVLPDATGQLLALLWSDRPDARDILECVRRDQALSAHVLRLSNSATFAPASPISDVQFGLSRIGIDKLREIAMALTLKQKVFQVNGWESVVKRLWRQAAVTSGFGCAVGKSCGAGAVRGGMVGLLIDVGKPMILGALHDVEQEQDLHLTTRIAETLMEEQHTAIGGVLAEHWQLPAWLATAIRFHHRFRKAEEHQLEATLGNFAYHLTLWAEEPDVIDEATLASLRSFRDLGFEPAQLEDFLRQRSRILKMARVYT